MQQEIYQFTEHIGDSVAAYCRDKKHSHTLTIYDSNTFAILGTRLSSGFDRAGLRNRSIILDGNELVPDESEVTAVLLDMDTEATVMIAVGSGTITDIVRFVSHRTGRDFISVPTAPSMDGYSSLNAPLIIGGMKQTVRCHAPSTIIPSIGVLSTAPREMIAAGFGDVIGKIIAIADWKLAAVVLDAPFDEAIARDTVAACRRTMDVASGIGRGDPQAIRVLFESLITTGNAIRRFGSSDPASGSEHHISHYLTMLLLRQHRPPILHGAQVGMATVLAAEWYRALRNRELQTIIDAPSAVPDFEDDSNQIRAELGEAGNRILEQNSFISTLDKKRVESIRQRVIEHWDDIMEIARSVAEPETVSELLRITGGSFLPEELGFSVEEIDQAKRLGHYVRSRFTLRTLMFTLGLPEPAGSSAD